MSPTLSSLTSLDELHPAPVHYSSLFWGAPSTTTSVLNLPLMTIDWNNSTMTLDPWWDSQNIHNWLSYSYRDNRSIIAFVSFGHWTGFNVTRIPWLDPKLGFIDRNLRQEKSSDTTRPIYFPENESSTPLTASVSDRSTCTCTYRSTPRSQDPPSSTLTSPCDTF